jgi:hypothetical protein
MGGPTDVDFVQVWKEKGNVIDVKERKSRWIEWWRKMTEIAFNAWYWCFLDAK